MIIDAFGDPTIAQDLNVEDTTFGLPAANLNVIYPNGQPTFNSNIEKYKSDFKKVNTSMVRFMSICGIQE